MIFLIKNVNWGKFLVSFWFIFLELFIEDKLGAKFCHSFSLVC